MILVESHEGKEGICLGLEEEGRWFASPDSRVETICMEFKKDFGLLVRCRQHLMTH